LKPKEATEVRYNNYLKSWEAFLEKPPEKSFAVGELSKSLKSRPWAAVWNHPSQDQADYYAVRACERVAPKCRVAWPSERAEERVTTTTKERGFMGGNLGYR